MEDYFAKYAWKAMSFQGNWRLYGADSQFFQAGERFFRFSPDFHA